MCSGSKQKKHIRTRSELCGVFSDCESLPVLLQHGIISPKMEIDPVGTFSLQGVKNLLIRHSGSKKSLFGKVDRK